MKTARKKITFFPGPDIRPRFHLTDTEELLRVPKTNEGEAHFDQFAGTDEREVQIRSRQERMTRSEYFRKCLREEIERAKSNVTFAEELKAVA
jgi:hypothetical protein